MKRLDTQNIISALQQDGTVASRLPHYEPRQSQLDLLSLIIQAFNEDAHVMAEAGTGVGKSFAYLLPAVHLALANKEKVVISTATITLQQQLFEKDIPLVCSATGEMIKAVIMKGRNNYLCLRRFDDAIKEPPLYDSDINEFEQIMQWARSTKTGVKSELSFVPSDSLWFNICSESDSCPGIHCPFRESCFIFKLRKEASTANIIVVNHHLLFADLAARLEGAGYENAVVLPPFTRLIIDEAHTIETAATSFFSSEFSRAGLLHRLSRLYHRKRGAEYGLLVRFSASLPSHFNALDTMADAVIKTKTAAEELDDAALQITGAQGIYRLSEASDISFLKKALFPNLKNLRKNILTLTNLIRDAAEQSADNDSKNDENQPDPVIWEIKSIVKRLEGIADICDVFCKFKKHEEDVLWIERVKNYAVFTRAPIDLAPKLKLSVFTPHKSVICVSATLALNNDFSFWASRCGINLVEKQPVFSGVFPSPFPYENSVLLASPVDAPAPDDEGWQDYINMAISKLIKITEGSALVLFTSYQTLTAAHNVVSKELSSLGIRFLKQGDDDRSRLLDTFVSDKSACLFATDSFWEGVDAPGDTLRLVILCRLPFRTPGDPILEARREKIEKTGGNPFMELSLPQAVTRFKQGFGRLMRKSSDYGIVAVLDSRLLKKSYGQLFLGTLPETRISFKSMENILKDVENFLY